MGSPIPVVVFADARRMLLDGDTSRPARDADAILSRESTTVVLSSSMTRAQIERRQQELGIRHPFICESGAAILIPHGWLPFEGPYDRDLPGYHAIELGRPYSEVVTQLHRASTRLGIPVIGFNDLSIEQVAQECRLSLMQARLAKLREYDEPFRLADPSPGDHGRLWKALRAARLACTHRDLLEHVGAAVDQQTSADVLLNVYRRVLGDVLTVTLEGSTDRASWLDAVVELARRARERRMPPAVARQAER